MAIPLCLLKIEELTLSHLSMWLKRRNINPITNKRIKIGTDVYNRLWRHAKAVIGSEKLEQMCYFYDPENKIPDPTKKSYIKGRWFPCPRKWIEYTEDQTVQMTGTITIPCHRCGSRRWLGGVHTEIQTSDSTKCSICKNWVTNRWYCKSCKHDR